MNLDYFPLASTTAIFSDLATSMGDMLVEIVPIILGFGVSLFALQFVIRKAWGYLRGV